MSSNKYFVFNFCCFSYSVDVFTKPEILGIFFSSPVTFVFCNNFCVQSFFNLPTGIMYLLTKIFNIFLKILFV